MLRMWRIYDRLYRALGDRGFAYRGRWQWAVMDWLAQRAKTR